MTKRPSFDKNYLKEEFDRLNAKTKQPLTLFLIGKSSLTNSKKQVTLSKITVFQKK
jgi:hypothetical protein